MDSFYAWIAGSDLQKSLQGLMRTLLHQRSVPDPEIISTGFPRRWNLFRTLRDCEKQPAWKDWELDESFNLLLAETTKGRRLAILIGGLDEFDILPRRVLDLIQNLTRSGIKVCVASRQWSEFNDVLDQHPMLRMQDMIARDMNLFVHGNIRCHRAFMDIKKTFPVEAGLLVQEVVDKASAVFICVSVVSKLLQHALNEGEGLEKLRSIVDSL